MSETLQVTQPSAAVADAETLLFVGRAERLLADDVTALVPLESRAAWAGMLEGVKPGDAETTRSTWTGGVPRTLFACVLPDVVSRHNCIARPDAISALVAPALKGSGTTAVLVALQDPEHARAAACAVARAVPRYSSRTTASEDRQIRMAILGGPSDLGPMRRAAYGVRAAADLVDRPTSELHTDAFVEEARAVAARVGASVRVIAGEELRDQGFGGLWGVGRAATRPPALVILSHEPQESSRTLCWVGKGIVYDTGGLSIKGKDNMPGMKTDMGGAAAVLAAFEAAVVGELPDRLHAVLCLAENAVGPDSFRPDDILHMYSGLTVEVNNTDAEGRLVLADGVAYACRHLTPDVLVDLATLTGAQLVATGRRHAAVVSDDGDLEAAAVAAGRRSGDLVHPLPYVPEFFRKEFRSVVADMKNSVKDRMNAQSSCAAQFVANHLPDDWDGAWLHVDIAGPSRSEERGTGFGVALLLELFGA